jgi:hypothetical protein
MASHWPFGYLQPKLWAKERPGVKLAIWLPTTKSRESTSSWHPIRVCNIALERSWRGLQLWFRPCRDWTLKSGVMAVQSFESPAGIISWLHFGSPKNLCHLDVASTVSCREYYVGEGGGFPQVWAVVWRAPWSRGELTWGFTKCQVAEVGTERHAPDFQL